MAALVAATCAPIVQARLHPARRAACVPARSPRSAFVARPQRVVRVLAQEVKAAGEGATPLGGGCRGARGPAPGRQQPEYGPLHGTSPRSAVCAGRRAARRGPPPAPAPSPLSTTAFCAAAAGAVNDNTWDELVLKSPVPVLVSAERGGAGAGGSGRPRSWQHSHVAWPGCCMWPAPVCAAAAPVAAPVLALWQQLLALPALCAGRGGGGWRHMGHMG